MVLQLYQTTIRMIAVSNIGKQQLKAIDCLTVLALNRIFLEIEAERQRVT